MSFKPRAAERSPDRPYFARHSSDFVHLSTTRPEFRERYALIEELIDRYVPARGRTPAAIDLGCGSGRITRALAERGFTSVALDASGEMLEIAKSSMPARLADRVRYVRAALPLGGAELEPMTSRLDLVVLSSVIEYVEDDHRLLVQCAEMLAPGGVLIATFPNRRSLYRTLERRFRGTPILARSYVREQLHTYVYEEVESALRDCDLEPLECTYFAMPLHWVLGRLSRRRSPRLATLFAVAARR